MKQLSLSMIAFFLFSAQTHSQQMPANDTTRVVLENNKMRVVEYVSSPAKDVCGRGKHSHGAHLSILLTDAKIQLTTADGKIQQFDLPAGATFWSEPETHIAINNSKKIIRAYLIELK